jgi:hypothetical protein
MKELTDMQICKNIAEIEGFTFAGWSEKQGKPSVLKDGSKNQGRYYNPLTNDALCFQLMIKYKVKLDYTSNFFSQAIVQDFEGDDEDAVLSSVSYWSDECSHNKAICLAIMEASIKQAKAA